MPASFIQGCLPTRFTPALTLPEKVVFTNTVPHINAPLEEARDGYLLELKKSGVRAKVERIPAAAAAGRMTAQPVYAMTSVPESNACAMDGVALEAKLTAGASSLTPVFLRSPQFTWVDTGNPLPKGCDAVVMAENITKCDDGGIQIISPAAPWQHVRQVGEDMCAGEMVLQSFSEITPAALGAIIACGVTEVDVVKCPVIGLIASGGGDDKEFGDAVYSTMIGQWGAETAVFYTENNSLDGLQRALSGALSACDAVVVCASAPPGTEVREAYALDDAIENFYRGVAIMPGKSVILGMCRRKPVIRIPANPVSGIIVLEELLRPVVNYLCNKEPAAREFTEATLTRQVASTLEFKEFIRVGLGYVSGKLIAMPLSRGGGVVSSFMKADGIIEIPSEHSGYKAGERAPVRLLRTIREVENAVVAIGSHDPLLDELSELMRRGNPGASVKSSHVGSMGGLMAIKRGEAHIAGTHLLDEASGGYNIPFIEKNFPNGGVRLVECVSREQGLMLQRGNPKSIDSVKDAARGDVNYINRQKGSGTRILFDYLCRRDGIKTANIAGYDREEYTHTSVAAIIAAGSADAGLGILTAARMYGLDFLHVCDEQYDLLIPDFAWDTPMVQQLIVILKSEAFASRLRQMGGYKADKPGEVRARF